MNAESITERSSYSNLGHAFARYVSLNMLGMVGLSCYILADTFFIAQGIGTQGLTALNLAIPAWSIMNGCGLMIGMGAATAFALSRAEDAHRGNSIFTQALIAAAVMSLVFLSCGVFLPYPIASMLGASGDILPMSALYLKTLLIFTPFFILNDLVVCFVRNDGSPHLAMIGMLVGSFANIALDYLFIFPLSMGIFGAALATGIAPILSLCVLSVHFLKKHNTFHLVRCPIHLKNWGRFCALGFSSFVNEVSGGLVIFVFNILILGIAGDIGVAAYGVVANIALVAIALFTGEAQGIQPLVSSLFGVGRKKDAMRVYRYAILVSIGLSLLIYVPSWLFALPLASLFNLDGGETLTQLAASGIRLYFLCFLFAGINILSAFYLSASGYPTPSFVIMMLRGFLISIPCVFIMSHLWGMTGIWLAMPVSEALTCCVSLVIMYIRTHPSRLRRVAG